MKLRKETLEILKKLKVRLLYLFGSTVTTTLGPKSDIDLGCVFNEDSIHDPHKTFIELYRVLSQEFGNREVDIIFLNNASLTLKFNVVTQGKVIYKDSVEFEGNFKEKVIKEYIDFKPLLDYNEKLILQRL